MKIFTFRWIIKTDIFWHLLSNTQVIYKHSNVINVMKFMCKIYDSLMNRTFETEEKKEVRRSIFRKIYINACIETLKTYI